MGGAEVVGVGVALVLRAFDELDGAAGELAKAFGRGFVAAVVYEDDLVLDPLNRSLQGFKALSG